MLEVGDQRLRLLLLHALSDVTSVSTGRISGLSSIEILAVGQVGLA
jgi:hypothetical protein